MPEPEIFAAMYGARTGVIAWLNTAKRSLASKVLTPAARVLERKQKGGFCKRAVL